MSRVILDLRVCVRVALVPDRVTESAVIEGWFFLLLLLLRLDTFLSVRAVVPVAAFALVGLSIRTVAGLLFVLFALSGFVSLLFRPFRPVFIEDSLGCIVVLGATLLVQSVKLITQSAAHLVCRGIE